MRVCKCDKCNKEISEPRKIMIPQRTYLNFVDTNGEIVGSSSLDLSVYEKDLCDDCLSLFNDVCEQFLNSN